MNPLSKQQLFATIGNKNDKILSLRRNYEVSRTELFPDFLDL